MRRSRLLQSVSLFIAVSFVTLSERVCAELMPLVEIHNVDNCFDCSPSGTTISFRALIVADPFPPQIMAEWAFFASPADVGRTFELPSDLLPVFNTIFTYPNLIHGTLSFFDNHSFISPTTLNFTATQGPRTVTRIAPNLGPNLAGYRLTNITQTIDELQYTNITPTRFRGTGSHTIRVYGEVIPEPACSFYVTIVLLVYSCLRVSLSRR